MTASFHKKGRFVLIEVHVPSQESERLCICVRGSAYDKWHISVVICDTDIP